MNGVLVAETAIFFVFYTIRLFAFIFGSGVIPLFAICAF
jgi:hypothetical protein